MSVVYFIQEQPHGNVKIGITNDINNRLQGLQNGNSRNLKLLAYFPGVAAEERMLHHKLHRYRLCGEWFTPCTHIYHEIKAHKRQGFIDEHAVSQLLGDGLWNDLVEGF